MGAGVLSLSSLLVPFPASASGVVLLGPKLLLLPGAGEVDGGGVLLACAVVAFVVLLLPGTELLLVLRLLVLFSPALHSAQGQAAINHCSDQFGNRALQQQDRR